MSLIIAIEPDREQATQLQDLVRRHTRAELILADTTEHAIGAIEQRVPDLVLIPAFLSPQDDEALTAALRAHEAAQHVQTLTIPLLGEPQSRSGGGGVLSRLRRDQRPASPDSCDPKLFAEQITEYLDRVARDRGVLTGSNGKGPGGNGHKPHGQSRPAAKPPAAAAPETTTPPTAPPNRLVAPAPPPRPRQMPPVAPAAAAPSPAATAPDAQAPIEIAPELVADDLAAAMEAALASEESSDLEDGLSSLMEKLSAEEWDDDPAAAPAAVAPSDTAARGAEGPADAAQNELKEIESLEYAMPKTILFHEEQEDGGSAAAVAEAMPAATEPPSTPGAAAAAEPQEPGWGDLLESLKKDLGR